MAAYRCQRTVAPPVAIIVECRQRKMKNNIRALHGAGVLALILVPTVYAADQPDAGRTLQQMAPVPALPAQAPALTIRVLEEVIDQPGGAQVTLQNVNIIGNTVFDTATVNAVLGDVAGKAYDIAGLKALAGRITAYYRDRGYPLARAYLTSQAIKDGQLHIQILEGRFGKVKAKSDNSADVTRLTLAQTYLDHLNSGAVVKGPELERATLLLNDLPGLQVAPVLRPGEALGTTDLDVQLLRAAPYSGDVSLDNFGNRYTGDTRASFNLNANSPFLLGDQIGLRSVVTQEGMWLGSVYYSLPLGSNGLRGNVGYSHTYYELGKDFDSLHAHGTADVASAGLSYPLIRSQKENLTFSATYNHKRLNDRTGATASNDHKRSETLPLTLSFDRRDSFGGGGVVYGSVAWTTGNLHLDSGLAAIDRTTAKTNGGFDKFNLDFVRLQALPNNFSFYARVSTQWSSGNLDSSEGFGLGGQNGVRAYPSGEGFGDEGVLGQIELRYTRLLQSGLALTPYAFFDSGHVKINRKRWVPGNNERNIDGSGLGLRAGYQNWSADIAAAWRSSSGKPQSDSQDNVPQVWFNLGYRF